MATVAVTRQPKIAFVAAVGSTLTHFVEPLAREASQRGWETIGCAEGAHDIAGFDRVYDLPSFRRRGAIAHARSLWVLARIVRQERPDVVHLHTPAALVIGRIVAVRYRIPSIAVVHGSFLDDRSWRRVAFEVAELATAWMASRTVVVNESDAAFYRRICRSGTVAMAPAGGIGLDPRIEQCAAQYLVSGHETQRSGSEGGALEPISSPPYLLYLGRLAADKNLDQLVRAWARAREEIPNLRLRIVGAPIAGDPAWTAPKIDGIDLLPWTDDPISEQLKATVAVSTSKREGFSMFVAESLVCGTPVVAVANRGTRMIARHGYGGICLVADETGAMAEAITRAVRSAGQRRLRADLMARWSRAEVCSFHLSLLAKLVDGGSIGGQESEPTDASRIGSLQPRPVLT